MNSIRDQYLEKLEEENEELRERVRQLEEIIGYTVEVPMQFGMTAHESRMLGLMMKRELCSREFLLTSLYGHLPPDDEPEIKIIDVYACKLRKKLKPFGIEIGTKWGQGYFLSAADKAKVVGILKSESVAA
jgi:two-component system cell cycle response regulator CtrA